MANLAKEFFYTDVHSFLSLSFEQNHALFIKVLIYATGLKIINWLHLKSLKSLTF